MTTEQKIKETFQDALEKAQAKFDAVADEKGMPRQPFPETFVDVFNHFFLHGWNSAVLHIKKEIS